MAEKYLPLRLMDIEDEIIAECGKDKDRLEKYGFPKTKDDDEFIDVLLRLFCGMYDSQKSEDLITCLFDVYGIMMGKLGMLNENNPKGAFCDIYDVCLRPTLYQKWKSNKQVYKPDPDFIKALIRTENLKITKDTFKHLPCKHFYIDVSDCDIFLPVKGMFVNIFEIEDKIMLVAYLVDESAFWSTYDILHFDIESEYEMNVSDLAKINPDGIYTYSDRDIFLYGKQPIKNDGMNLDANESKFFIYQLITYLTSHEPQFEESPITKSTYRPPKQGTVIKNKFSEIQMHDIGIRFGKSFREQQKKYKCNTFLTRHLENKRKSPIPHFRCAHWQGYWVGKGRTDHVVRWIEPIFVGGGESNDVVIHKI